MEGTRLFLRSCVGTCILLACSGFILDGCSLNRAGTGCGEGLETNEIGRCVPVDAMVADAGDPVDARVDSGRDAGPDAFMPDDAGPDAGSDAPDAWVDPDGGPLDAGPVDAGTDACVPVAEICGDGIDQNCDGSDMTCPLRIIFNAATVPTGIAFHVVWIEPPPTGRLESPWYYHACRVSQVGSRVQADCDAPELASGRTIQFFPYDATVGSTTCSSAAFADCPSSCDTTSCPGYPPRGTFSYGASYLSRPLLEGEFVFNPDTAGAGPAPGDTATLEFRLP